MLLLAPAIVDAERLPARVFTTADGLANNAVNRIVHDSRGYLWFCTREGLSRFDGHGFTTYGIDEGLPSAVINDLIETREGPYWIATSKGTRPVRSPWNAGTGVWRTPDVRHVPASRRP